MSNDGRLTVYPINRRFVRYDLNEVDGALKPDVGLVVAAKVWFGWSQPRTWSGPDDDTTE